MEFEDLLKEVVTPQNINKSIQKIVHEPIGVSKPPNTFITIHPEKVFCFSVLEFESEGSNKKDDYLVLGKVAHLLQDELKVKNYHLYTTTDKVYGLWGIRCENDAKVINRWMRSGVIAKKEAMASWVRITSNMAKQGYDVVRAHGDLGQPVWPEYSDEEILKFAFGDKIIGSENHFIIKKLRGEVL